MARCLLCIKGEMVKDNINSGWYKCNYCGSDSDNVVDGFAYPTKRRGTLCSFYTPAINLNVTQYQIGDIIKFSTSKKNKKKAKVLHVDKKGDQMIIQEDSSNKIHFVIDNQRIENVFDALFEENKVIYKGWWKRKIKING